MTLNISNYSRFDFDKFLSTTNLSKSYKNSLNCETLVFDISDSQLKYYFDQNIFTFDLVHDKTSANKDGIIIILSKDNGHILEYSLSYLYEFEIDQHYDILLVDDRSESDDILNISKRYNTSFLRIDNNKNIFNYSMLNNIAIGYAKYRDKKLCLFYNNDLWPRSKDTIHYLVNKHKVLNSDITGCRLIYPSEKEYNDLQKPQHIFGSMLNDLYGSIQHGGIFFAPKNTVIPKKIILGPIHQWRFYPQDHYLAKIDTQCFAVTGALHIIDIDKFIFLGGFTPSLSTSFQDIDLCIKAIEAKMSVNYVGSDYMVHAESLTHFKNQVNKSHQFISDNIFWDFVWGHKLPNILGHRYET